MGRGKCGRAILGSLGKVTSAGSDKDVIRTCFPGHILHCGETSPTQSCCHKLSASLLCTPGQGKLEKPVNPWLAGAREGYLQSAATAFVWLWQQRSSTSPPMLRGLILGAGGVSLPCSAHTRGPGAPNWSCLALAEAQQTSLHPRTWCVGNPASKPPPCPCPLCGTMPEWSGRA